MTQKILISTSPHVMFVEAEIIGAFAVHPHTYSLDMIAPDDWVVTHLFSGFLVSPGGDDDFATEADACQFAHDLMALPIDWYFGGASFEDGHAAAKPIVGPYLARRRMAQP